MDCTVIVSYNVDSWFQVMGDVSVAVINFAVFCVSPIPNMGDEKGEE